MKTIRKDFLGLLWVLLFQFGCTSVQIDSPVAQVEAPQDLKAKSWSMAIRGEESSSVSYGGLNERPPAISPTYRVASFASGLGQYAFAPWIQLGLGFGTPLIFGGMGVIGRLSLHSPWQGPWKIVLVGDGGTLSAKTSGGDQKQTFGPGGYDWKASGYSNFGRQSCSIGYELSENYLMFLGYGRSKSTVHVKTEQAVATDDPGGSFERQDEISSEASALGFRIDLSQQSNFSFSAQRTWVKFLDEGHPSDSLSLSLHFML